MPGRGVRDRVMQIWSLGFRRESKKTTTHPGAPSIVVCIAEFSFIALHAAKDTEVRPRKEDYIFMIG